MSVRWKLNFLIILSTLACALLVAIKWTTTQATQGAIPAEKSGDEPLHLTPDTSTLAQPTSKRPRPEPDRAKFKEILRNGYGDGAFRAHDAMEAFLESWDPMGRSPQELRDTLGKPSVEKTDSFTYIFDNGSFGWLYKFVMRDGQVIELQRPKSE